MTRKVYNEQVREAVDLLSQPDSVTCQATCICMATGSRDIAGTRRRLLEGGQAGDPANMGRLLKEVFSQRYSFTPIASLLEVREWLKNGEFLITHGWFTQSGHVICLDGVELDDSTLSYRLNVKDPWSEFDFKSWLYNKPSVTVFDGYYSSYGIYAACVKGSSPAHASWLYKRGELDSSLKGMWVHRIRP